MLSDEELLRYSRQIMLPQVDIGGQQALLDASVLVVGAGGLGCPAALYLAASGIGRLLINDFDTVELSNLQRQIAHTEAALSHPKVESLKVGIQAINASVQTELLGRRLTEVELCKAVASVDVVLDCSDNFETRHLINKVCVQKAKPLVSGAAIGFDGQVAVFNTAQEHSPCYRCLYPDEGELSLSCADNGVISPLVGVIGAMQALEAVKLLSGAGEPLVGALLLFDGLAAEWRRMKLKRDPKCPVCSSRPLESY
ncbi:MAG: molybdopterin-synthase adenylyltransferase MoeB [Gammaproteobacteria bacterium]|nr:molybdopterin-synthase adenylyltransferase MoeB [Gammaproteobacteria bacterium]